jgi:purine-binding chemotaxis protein CheW
MQLVVFALGDEEYGLPITQVQEIIRFSEPRTIPNPHAAIRGVINLRGRILPVCDLKLQLNVGSQRLGRPDRGRRERGHDGDRGSARA